MKAAIIALLSSTAFVFAASAPVPVCRDYVPSGVLTGMAHSYACPTLFDWDGDGLLDLVVGEITPACTGKARLYINRGTPGEPRFTDFAYIQRDGEDMEFSAKGCVGLQVSFGNVDGGTMMFISTSNGRIYGCDAHQRRPDGLGSAELVTWFDHSVDKRFSGLIRSCTFCADIDGDGSGELVVSGQNSPIFWVKRVGTGAFAKSECSPLLDATGMPLRYPQGQSHASAVVFDITGDGIADVVTGDTVGNVWVYMGLGGARFSPVPAKIYANADTDNIRSRLAVGDIDGDGIEDILSGRQDGSVLVLKGLKTFSPLFNFFGTKREEHHGKKDL